jgi:macrolide transport system ATP-binding/permease protein
MRAQSLIAVDIVKFFGERRVLDGVWPDPSRTPRDLYGHHDTPLADLGLVAPKDLDRPIGTLSVGQRRRLALAQLIADPPHLLLLDEPTNHLSLTLADELEHALGKAPGTVVIATHDRWLRRHWQHPELSLNSQHSQAVAS